MQTDVVVTDKNDDVVTDLQLADFELFENGKKQVLQFIEFVSVDAAGSEKLDQPAKTASDVDTSVPRDLTATVRELNTRKIGSVSRYFEVPDLSNKRLTLSSIMRQAAFVKSSRVCSADVRLYCYLSGNTPIRDRLKSGSKGMTRYLSSSHTEALKIIDGAKPFGFFP